MNHLPAIHLHGSLADNFGGPYRLDVQTPFEAVRALSYQLPGFKEAVAAGEWELIRGDQETGMLLDLDSCRMRLGRSDLHIIPAPRGAGGKGAGKIVIGVALVALAVVTAGAAAAAEAAALGAAGTAVGTASVTAATATGGLFGAGWGLSATAFAGISFGQIAGIGASLLIAGISQMMTPTPKPNTSLANQGSYLLNGAVNTNQEGTPVPIVYGDVLVGSVVGSAYFTTMNADSQAQVYYDGADGVLVTSTPGGGPAKAPSTQGA